MVEYKICPLIRTLNSKGICLTSRYLCNIHWLLLPHFQLWIRVPSTAGWPILCGFKACLWLLHFRNRTPDLGSSALTARPQASHIKFCCCFFNMQTDQWLSATSPTFHFILYRQKPKRSCFNCGGDHSLGECREPRNQQRIRENMMAFKNAQANSSMASLKNRYTNISQIIGKQCFKTDVIDNTLVISKELHGKYSALLIYL